MSERTLEAFEAARRPRWVELAALVTDGRSRKDGSAEGLVRTLTLVRLVSGDLAWARRRFTGASVVEELEVLLTSARPLLDRPARRPLEVVADAVVLARDVVTRSRRLLALAAVLLLMSVALGALWALTDPVGAQVVLTLHDRIPPEPGRTLPDVTGLPVGTASSGTSWSLVQAGGAAVLALVGGALVGLGTAAVVLLWGLRLGVGLALALQGGQGARVVEGLGASGLALGLVLVLGACAGLTAAAGVVGRRPLAAATTDAAVIGALAVPLLVPALVGIVVAGSDPTTGAVAGGLVLAVVLGGLVAVLSGHRAATIPDDPAGL